jgi:Amt family ammonium transporter
MLCAGSLREKNVKNIMLQNILDACGGAIGFFFCGYSFAFGSSNSFIGSSGELYALNGLVKGTDYIDFFFQFAFAASAATIVAGTIAERCKMVAYFCYALMLTSFVYPVVVHVIWSDYGFLTSFGEQEDRFRGVGMIDFAGSGVVHMTGGMCALIGALVLGPRQGRFHDSSGRPLAEPVTFAPHSVTLQVLGTFILWFGWYGFNAGSTLGISDENAGHVAALAAVNTTMSGAAAAVSAMFLESILNLKKSGEVEYDLTMAMNGGLAGLVGVTGACAVVEPWAAFIIGAVSGCIYCLGSSLLIKLRIDDAVDGIPVHLMAGMWGCIATGLFAEPMRTRIAYGEDVTHFGWFYSWANGSADANLLLAEIVGILFIVAWTVGIMGPFFFLLDFLGLFRVDALEEEVGLDASRHKGSVYDDSGRATKSAMEKLNCSRHGGSAPDSPVRRSNSLNESLSASGRRYKKVMDNSGHGNSVPSFPVADPSSNAPELSEP